MKRLFHQIHVVEPIQFPLENSVATEFDSDIAFFQTDAGQLCSVKFELNAHGLDHSVSFDSVENGLRVDLL